MSCYNYLCEKNNLGQIQSIGIYDIVHNNTEAFHFIILCIPYTPFFQSSAPRRGKWMM